MTRASWTPPPPRTCWTRWPPSGFAPLFVITGGDPFQRPDLTELIAYGREAGVRTAVSPSGTPTLTAERLCELHAAGAAGLSLSLSCRWAPEVCARHR
ncbi:hypothetical protein [Streptomyces sp. NPDC006274]|uniref:hypothetical protein n=1 Tax=unclassified Streptomyces TaxID=2593676 RepID=UPI0033B1F7CC